jgi:hypothetical protein
MAYLILVKPCPPCPEAVTRVFCFEVEGRQREVPYDDMIMKIVEDVKICAELEPESKWFRLHDSYMANLDIISSEATHADTVCFKSTDCTEEP